MINYAVVVDEICTHKYKNITSADWLITAITHLHCVVIRTSSATNERTGPQSSANQCHSKVICGVKTRTPINGMQISVISFQVFREHLINATHLNKVN